MQGFFSRVGWFLAISVAISYAIASVAGNIVNAQAAGTSVPILVRDELQANAHHLAGMVMVQSSCDELSVDTQMLSKTSYALVFETWHEPSVDCVVGSTPRAFHTTLFAPASGVYFVATLDGKDLPIAVVPVINGTARY